MLSDGDITVPSVQLVVAIPLALVVELGWFTVPPPSVTVQPIGTPATGLLNWSITRTASATGSVWPTVSTWASPDSMVICVAPPTVALTLNVTVLDPPASVAVAVVACVPAPAPSVRTVLARPLWSVVDTTGCTEPPPVAAAQVTETPGTGLPCASAIRTTCGVWSAVLTCPVRLSRENFEMVAGGPGVTVAVKYTGLPPSTGAVAAWSESVPATVPSVHAPTWATPAPLVV